MLPIRDDQPRYSTPWVTWFLIGLNLVIFLMESALDPRSLNLVIHQFGVVPYHLAAFLAGSSRFPLPVVVLPFFTSMFLHASWMHVIGNMWFLLYFWRQCGGLAGTFQVSGVLSADGIDCDDDAGRD